ARTESELFLKNQPGYSNLDEDIRIINEHYPDFYSGIRTNPQGTTVNQRIHSPRVDQMLDELTSTLGNIEPSWSHNPTNDELRSISEVLDKCTRAWWERTYAVERIVETLWWSAANRT